MGVEPYNHNYILLIYPFSLTDSGTEGARILVSTSSGSRYTISATAPFFYIILHFQSLSSPFLQLFFHLSGVLDVGKVVQIVT